MRLTQQHAMRAGAPPLAPASGRRSAARRPGLAPASQRSRGSDGEGAVDGGSVVGTLRRELACSQRFGPAALEVRSWAFGLACLLAAAASLTAFNLITQQIVAAATAAGYQGDPAAIGLLDLRRGYSPAEVAATLEAWTPRGRLLYVLVEAIDVSCYMSAYRGVGLVLANRAAGPVAERWPAAGWVRRAAALPFILAATDLLEDGLQVTATLAFSAASPPGSAAQSAAWQALVAAASAVNQVKWTMVPCFSAALAALAAVAGAALLLPGRGGER